MRKQEKIRSRKDLKEVDEDSEDILLNAEKNQARGEKDILRFLIEFAPIRRVGSRYYWLFKRRGLLFFTSENDQDNE
jgi:hypothetical protein